MLVTVLFTPFIGTLTANGAQPNTANCRVMITIMAMGLDRCAMIGLKVVNIRACVTLGVGFIRMLSSAWS